MKLKMAENSIFAILLRKPWWVSLLVVAVFFLLSGALLPAQYVPFGVMGSFPFVVIAVMAAWRQRHTPSAASVAAALSQAASMAWRDFSARLAQGFGRQGYTVQKLNEPGFDFLLTQSAQMTLVSCKRWKAASHGIDGLRDLLAAKQARGAQQCIYISLGMVSDAARKYAKAEGVHLMTEAELAQLLMEK